MSDDRQKDDLIGKQVGQYEIIEEIGRGGMATVYRARQKSMNRTVAIKVLPRHLLHDPGFYERFEREVDVIAHLEHPHILPTYDYGQADNVPYIVMRFLGGGSMEQMIKRGRVDPQAIEKPLRQIAQALDYAHQQGIIHRDIKPGNIMLDETGNAYLSDFGIARVLGSEMTGSMIVGTPAYMSPEQANGFPIDGRADIYALGVVLFELLTGEEPHQAETPMAVLLKHINEPMPPLKNYRDDIPDPLEDVIFKSTSKKPEERYASAGDMAKAYSDALHGRATAISSPTEARPPSQATRPAGDVAPLPAIDASTETSASALNQPTTQLPAQPQAGGSKRGIFIGGFVALLIVAGIIAGVVLSSGGGNDTSDLATFTPIPPPPVFPGGEEMRQDDYRIVVLREWVRPPLGHVTVPLDGENVAFAHRWEDDNDDNDVDNRDDTAYIELQMHNIEMTDADAFRQAIIDYEAQYLAPVGLYFYQNESIAPNGTVVRSFEVFGSPERDALPPGQIDFIYMNYGDALVVYSAYASFEAGNDYVDTFNAMYESLRMRDRDLADPRVVGEVTTIGEPAWNERPEPPADVENADDGNDNDNQPLPPPNDDDNDNGDQPLPPPNNDGDTQFPPPPAPNANIVTVDEDVYSITLPQEFILAGEIPYTDLSDEFQVAHVYQIFPSSFAIMIYSEQADTSTRPAFNRVVQNHIDTYYTRDNMTFVSENTDQQGRRIFSYTFAGDENFPPGEMRLVYFPNTPYLVMMELYRAEGASEIFDRVLSDIMRSVELHTE